MTALDLAADWPVPAVSAAVVHAGAVVSEAGDADRVQPIASLSKPMAAWATLVAVEEGIVTLDQPVGQPGCTLGHLLAHAGGYPFDGNEPIARPGARRIYSNTGFELAAAAVAEAADMDFAEYLRLAVFEPLDMSSSELVGSAALGVRSCSADMIRFVIEVMSPSLLTAETAADARRVHHPGLSGIVPGVGRYDHCPWGLGFEVRGDKQPHWTGTTNSPRTYGHFGGAGTMFWIDPDVDIGVIALADRKFDEWSEVALRAWPTLSDAVVAEFGAAGAAR